MAIYRNGKKIKRQRRGGRPWRKIPDARWTCRVQFDGVDGHLHTATIRIPGFINASEATMLKLAHSKTGIKPRSMFGVTCGSTHGAPLPHVRKARK